MGEAEIAKPLEGNMEKASWRWPWQCSSGINHKRETKELHNSTTQQQQQQKEKPKLKYASNLRGPLPRENIQMAYKTVVTQTYAGRDAA